MSEQKEEEFTESCPGLTLSIFHVMVPPDKDNIPIVDLEPWDVYTEFVVCCSTKEEAINYHPDGTYEWWKTKHANAMNDWIRPKDINRLVVTREGYTENMKHRILCASFHAG